MTTRVKSSGAEGRCLSAARSASNRCEPLRTGEIALRHKFVKKGRIIAARSEVSRAAYSQRLVHGFFGPEVRLLDITVLVSASGRVRRRLHAVMGKQRTIVLRELMHSFAIEVAYGCSQVVGAVGTKSPDGRLPPSFPSSSRATARSARRGAVKETSAGWVRPAGAAEDTALCALMASGRALPSRTRG